MIQCAIFRLAIVFVAFCIPVCCVRADDNSKFVVVLYPEANDGSPGSVLADRGIRGVSGAYQGAVEVHNEYLDVLRFPDSSFQDDLAKFLRRKYAGRKTDLVIAGLGSGLDYAQIPGRDFSGRSDCVLRDRSQADRKAAAARGCPRRAEPLGSGRLAGGGF